MQKLGAGLALAALLLSSCQSPVSTSPTPGPTETPRGTPTSLYYARDQLPPVRTGGPVLGGGGEERTRAALDALARQPAPTGLTSAFPIRATLASVKIAGDLVTVDYTAPGGDWGLSGSARVRALVQQIVYTAAEEPGLRRVLITQNGGQRAVIGGEGLVVDRPVTREDVVGYAQRASTDAVSADEVAERGEIRTWRASVEDFGPGLTRFVVEFGPGAPRGSMPHFTVSPRSVDGKLFKWELRLEVPDVAVRAEPGKAFHCCVTQAVDRTPLRRVSAGPLTPDPARPGATFSLELDDLRPWRATVLSEPMRIVLDIGGHPQAVATNTAVYAPLPGATVARTFMVSGLARRFEANVPWRVKDQGGRVVASGFTTASLGTSAIFGTFEFTVRLPENVSGNVTLEVFEVSMADGSEREVVSIPVTVR